MSLQERLLIVFANHGLNVSLHVMGSHCLHVNIVKLEFSLGHANPMLKTGKIIFCSFSCILTQQY